MPIPEKVVAIHGISNEDVKDAPTFNEVAKSIARDFEGCDLGGYNSVRFDIPLLAEEFLRSGVDIDLKRRKFVDVQVIFMKMEPRTLSAAYKFFANKELENAHSAEADTRATYEVLQAQLDRYSNLENDIGKLAEFSAHNRNVDFAGRIVYNEDDVEVFNFGKYKGTPVSEVLDRDPGYYGWMMRGDFPLYTKKVLTSIKLSSIKK
jgi:DNA polymerase-3 subunit epsilon